MTEETGPPLEMETDRDSDYGPRTGWANIILDAAKALRNNGDKWEENARKSWRREDAINNRWLAQTQEIGKLGARLAEVAKKLEAAEREARLLADQRDRLLGHCQMVESVRHQKMVALDEIYGILITDGSDNP